MSKQHCDRLWEVDALREGRLGPKDAESAERHTRACEVCSAARSRSEELDAWIENASSPQPTSLEMRRVRVRVLRSVGEGQLRESPRVRARVAFSLAMLVAVGAVAFVVYRHSPLKTAAVAIATPPPTPSISSSPMVPDAPIFLAAVRAADGTRWNQTRTGSTEHIALDEGTLAIDVRHHDDQQHVVVDLPDGTIEDRGTRFEVDAHGGHTTRVAVREGTVALHVRGGAEVLVRAGSTWPTSLPARVSSTSPASSAAHADDDGSTSYAAAMSLLRTRQFAPAARAFHDYVQAHPQEPDAEDASYLEAVALAQAGDPKGAMSAAERHLASYPRSFHRREASLLVARIARDGGDCDKARKILAPWLGATPDPDAQATLRACVDP
jgi:hypothetical protein